MQLKKIGSIKQVMNGTAFTAIPKLGVIAVLHNNSDLYLYKNCQLVSQIPLGQVGQLEKFTEGTAFLFSRMFEQVFFIDALSYQVVSYPLEGHIFAKVGIDYFINRQHLRNFRKATLFTFEQAVDLVDYYNSYYPANPECGYIFGHSKTCSVPNWLGDVAGTYVSGYSLKTGKGVWEYSFVPHPEDVKRAASDFRLHFLGNTLNQVWLRAASGSIAVLDVQTGKELKRLGKPNWAVPTSDAEVAWNQLGRSFLSENKWVALSKHHYFEVSTKTFKLKYVNLQPELEPYGLSCMLPCFDNKHIYFYDSNWIGNSPRGKVGILDRKTLKVIWCWDMFQELKVAPLHIEVVDNQLYVLDNGLTLHVFEVPK